MTLENITEVRKWGNSGGVLLPREWLGKQVKITLIDRTEEIRKEVMEILEEYMEDIIGIYLCGSYARGEQNKNSDVDIVVITSKTKKVISSGKYHLELYTLDSIRNTIKNNPVMIMPRLLEAKVLINSSLLLELNSSNVSKGSCSDYVADSKRALKINKDLINLNKSFYMDNELIYSLVLRLRGLYLIRSMLENKPYSNKSFYTWLENSGLIKSEIIKTYSVYQDVRDRKKAKTKIPNVIGEKLIALLEKEVKSW